MNDVFGPGSNVERRVFRDYDALAKKISACREMGFKIVLTSGTFDLFHIGHGRYLEQAKSVLGDPNQSILVVGVDSDERVHERKGPDRPMIPEDERLEIVCHVRHVDIVFLKPRESERNTLLKTVRPDAFVRSATTKQGGFSDKELAEVKQFCGEVRVLEAQATTSTTARIRLFLITSIAGARKLVDDFHAEITKFFDQLAGGDHDS